MAQDVADLVGQLKAWFGVMYLWWFCRRNDVLRNWTRIVQEGLDFVQLERETRFGGAAVK